MPPLPPAAMGAAIQGGTSIINNALNAISQGFTNRAERRWNEKMYNRQNEDQIKFWNMQNEYNSPINQMKRFQEAGLNKNLIYGQTNTADPVKVSDVKSWNPRAPQFDFSGLGSSLGTMYDLELKGAQTDNVRSATKIAMQDATLRAIASVIENDSKIASTAKTKAETETAKFNLSQAQALQSSVLEKARLENISLERGIEKTKADTKFTLDQNDRAAASNKVGILSTVEAILRSRAERGKVNQETKNLEQALKLMQQDQDLKDLDIELKKQGIQPSDALLMRILGKYLGGTYRSGDPTKINFNAPPAKGGAKATTGLFRNYEESY